MSGVSPTSCACSLDHTADFGWLPSSAAPEYEAKAEEGASWVEVNDESPTLDPGRSPGSFITAGVRQRKEEVDELLRVITGRPR